MSLHGDTPVRIGTESLILKRSFSPDELARHQKRIAELAIHYYQRLAIDDAAGQRLETPGSHLCVASLALFDRHGFPADLGGKKVLDIGCNAGFYSFVAKLRGAASVLGIDPQPHYVQQALLLREILGLDVAFRTGDQDSLSSDERFDVVLNTGVIYHLQNPMDFLTKVARITGEMMYLESEVLTDPKYSEHAWFIEGAYGGDTSNWWVYGPQCVERMVRAAGFREAKFQGFVWQPPPGTRTPEGFLRQGRGVFVCRK